ncbi:MAG: arsenate reductase ArsC [Parasphingorhabdus sp.]
MRDKVYNVLFLCTGNSARSILGEAILNREGEGRFRAYSAGSFPRGDVHPMALEILNQQEFDTSNLRSKSWDEFAAEDAPHIDFIFTVCGNAEKEVCPVWLGHPVSVHWGIDDPAEVEGDGQREAFLNAFDFMRNRIRRMLDLPLDSVDPLDIKKMLTAIGTEESIRERSA